MSDQPSSPHNPTLEGVAPSSAGDGQPVIDTAEFCRRGQQLRGNTPITGLPRFADGLFDETGSVGWALRGWQLPNDEGGNERRMALQLKVQAAVCCDRCLQRLPIAYEVEREYLLLRTERLAAQADADVDDYDVLVSEANFDVLDLIEDEAIMAQPLLAEHESCDLPIKLEPEAPDDRPNPFAALAALKRRAGPVDPEDGER